MRSKEVTSEETLWHDCPSVRVYRRKLKELHVHRAIRTQLQVQKRTLSLQSAGGENPVRASSSGVTPFQDVINHSFLEEVQAADNRIRTFPGP